MPHKDPEKRKAYYRKYSKLLKEDPESKEKLRLATKNWRSKQYKKGLCTLCTESAVSKTAYFCERHQKYSRAFQKKLYYERSKQKGVCVMCGRNSVQPGHKLCEKHYLTAIGKNHKPVLNWKDLKLILKQQNYKCFTTGEDLILGDNAHLDHIVPISKGGLHEISNVRWVIKAFNRAKYDLTDEEFSELCIKFLTFTKQITNGNLG